jgi:hypothetical protein
MRQEIYDFVVVSIRKARHFIHISLLFGCCLISAQIYMNVKQTTYFPFGTMIIIIIIMQKKLCSGSAGLSVSLHICKTGRNNYERQMINKSFKHAKVTRGCTLHFRTRSAVRLMQNVWKSVVPNRKAEKITTFDNSDENLQLFFNFQRLFEKFTRI